MNYPRLQSAGEGAMLLYLAERPCADVTARLGTLVSRLPHYLGNALLELIPSYHSLLIVFDPLHLTPNDIRHALMQCLVLHAPSGLGAGKLIELPVYYSPESGADLERLATRAGLSVAEVIALHQQTEYWVYAVGFAPGFAYLGEVDRRIAAPRLSTPRASVPKGSVAIAERQTAVYPSASPGGWNLIGRCPTPLFDAEKTPPMAFAVGDRVRFKAIDRQTYLALGGQL